MTRIRVFVAALAAAAGLFTAAAPTAGAIIVNIRIGENTGTPPPTPEPGSLLSLCLQIRPNPGSCINI
jgi:hypothetical protein